MASSRSPTCWPATTPVGTAAFADRSDKATEMRRMLDLIESDERFETALTPTGTGLLIALKR